MGSSLPSNDTTTLSSESVPNEHTTSLFPSFPPSFPLFLQHTLSLFLFFSFSLSIAPLIGVVVVVDGVLVVVVVAATADYSPV